MERVYKTRNLQIAAFLCASKIQFTGAEKIDRSFFFKFAPKEKAEELINQYFSNKATVNPKELFSRLNELKDLIFSR